jgi:ABC-type transport system involved in cytochrome c biogenesis ATPase subunit
MLNLIAPIRGELDAARGVVSWYKEQISSCIRDASSNWRLQKGIKNDLKRPINLHFKASRERHDPARAIGSALRNVLPSYAKREQTLALTQTAKKFQII